MRRYIRHALVGWGMEYGDSPVIICIYDILRHYILKDDNIYVKIRSFVFPLKRNIFLVSCLFSLYTCPI